MVVDITEDDFISIPERGVIYFNNGIILQDYTYEITNYKVFRGAMAELQKEIEGNPSFGNILTGFRSAGCRVRVVYPIVQNIVFEARVIIDNNFNIDETLAEVQEAILAFVNSRDVGQELRVADMTREIMTTQNILSIAFFDGPEPLEDTFTASGKEVIRIREADIEVTSVF